MIVDPITHALRLFSGDTTIEEQVFGTADPDAIRAVINEFCRQLVGSSIGEGIFAEKSIGVVYGFRLNDGHRVVIKGRQSWILSSDSAAACLRLQAALHRVGFPAPMPLGDPTPITSGTGYLTAEEFVEGNRANGHEPALRRAMAFLLADLIRLAAGHGDDGLRDTWWDWYGGPLWPTPHSSIFDLTRPGGEWIDELGYQSRAVLRQETGAAVVGHGDWTAKNMVTQGDKIVGVFDWDSVRIAPEPHILGAAASHFTQTWYLDVPRAPSVDEVDAFINDYEQARGRPFTRDGRRQVDAAAVFSLGYTARCELGSRIARTTKPGPFQLLLKQLMRRIE